MLTDAVLNTWGRSGLVLAQVAENDNAVEALFVNLCGSEADRSAECLAAVDLLSRLVSIVLILAIAFVINRLARSFIKRGMRRLLAPPSERSERARQAFRNAAPSALFKTSSVNIRLEARVHTLTAVFRSIASVIIWFVAVVAALQVARVNLTSLIAISTVVGAAVGFGAQNIVRDFLAGMFIVIEDQFGVGDIVDVGGDAKGTVEEVTLRSTKVRDVNGTVWHVPNGQILRVANKSQQWARAVLDIEVDGGTDYDAASRLISQVADTMAAEEQWMPDILDTPQVWGIESFTDKGYTIRLVIKTRPGTQFSVLRELRIRLQETLPKAGIVVPGRQWATENADKLTPPKRGRLSKAAVAADTDPTAPHPPRGDPGEAG
jgi:moderate conductance mechanosensitive channel